MTGRRSDSFIYRDPDEAVALRARIRALIDTHLPKDWLGPFTKDPADLAISNRFCEILAEEGLLVPNWPDRYGGQDLDLASSIVIREEMWAHFEPRGGQYYGPNWVGPSIFDYGTDDQKALHLPLIASGKAIWCQGFSEPDAGSDLANLKTRAVPDGDGFRITGQKIWTSWALWAEWCYLLARVDGSPVGKSEGVTVFLIPMNREGVTVRGMDGIPGPHHLNEVFLVGVWASRSEVLGDVGNGWQVMRDALSNERVGIARYARDDRLISKVFVDAGAASALPPGRWLQVRVRNRMSRLMCRRALWFQRDGGSHDFIVSAARMITTRTNLLTADALGDALGDEFFEDRHTQGAPVDGAVEFFWRYMQAGPIASGTTEMLQRNLSRTMFRGGRIRVTEDGSEMRGVIDRVTRDLGGVDATRRAIAEPRSRSDLLAQVEPVLQSLDPRDGYFEGVSAAEICRGAGAAVLALPIEAMLLRRPSGRPLALVSSRGRIEHGDLFSEWDVSIDGGQTEVVTWGPDLIGSKVGPFVSKIPPVRLGDGEPLSSFEHAMLHVLNSWYVFGALEMALDLATVYATERVAFGSPIAAYQGVAFPLADACSELQAFYELALYSLNSVYESPESALSDALALKWATADSGPKILRIAHQVLGAVGQCDEHDLSIITLTLQARLRLPFGTEECLRRLAVEVEQSGFDSLFPPVGSPAT
jgi:alkylation response protein AidB-like acyl-CoA dehydrogenase